MLSAPNNIYNIFFKPFLRTEKKNWFKSFLIYFKNGRNN